MTVTQLLVFLLFSLILKLSFSRRASGRGGIQHDDKNNVLKRQDVRAGLCMCSHDSKHTSKEGFIGPARCGLSFLNVPAGPLLPNLGSKSLFPISGLCYTD